MKKFTLYFIIFLVFVTIIMSFASAETSKLKNASIVLDLSYKEQDTSDEVKRSSTIHRLSQFILPTSVVIIEDEAFEGTAIDRVELPESLTSIGDRAFANISTLRYIRIPMATNTISSTAFSESIYVTIMAAPNSYAKLFAKNRGLLFLPISTFCSSTSGTVTSSISNILPNKAIEVDSSDTQELLIQRRRIEEVRAIGKQDIIYYSIQGRGPPMM